jgi:hypothetical protein
MCQRSHFSCIFSGRQDWSLNSGLCTCKVGTVLLEPDLLSILLWLFWRWVWRTLCLSWPQIVILPISVSQLARITGVSHQHQAHTFFFNMNILYLFFSPIDLGSIAQHNDETRLGIFIMILTFKKSQRLSRHPLFYVNFHGCPSPVKFPSLTNLFSVFASMDFWFVNYLFTILIGKHVVYSVHTLHCFVSYWLFFGHWRKLAFLNKIPLFNCFYMLMNCFPSVSLGCTLSL